MKKLTLLLMLVVFALSGWAQTLLTQNFSGTFPPTGWTKEDLYQAQWTQGASANAGGTTPELKFSYITGNGTSRFVSPAVDLTGNNTVTLRFKHSVDHYGAGYTLGVATRTGTGAWTVVWSMAGAAVTAETREVTISNANTNLPNFQFCFFITGNTYQINYWYIDDVTLFVPLAHDVSVYSINNPVYLTHTAPITPTATIKNVGLNTETSFSTTLKIYNYTNTEIYTNTQTVASLASGATTDVNYGSFTLPSADCAYKIKTYTSMAGDLDRSNDTLNKWVYTYTSNKQKVMVEIGTGTWCTYCPGAAMGADDLVTNGHNVAIVENHNGDSYAYTASNARNTYYGISGYPTAVFDGKNSVVGGNHSTSMYSTYLPIYNAQYAIKTAFGITISGTHSGDNYTMNFAVNKIAQTMASNLVLHVAVTQSHIMENWQGQTHLEFVSRLMAPNENGTPLNFGAQTTLNIPITFALNSAWGGVLANHDYEVIAWVQDLGTKEVYNAQKMDLDLIPVGINEIISNNINVYPNPASNYVMINNAENANIQVYDVMGNKVLDIKNISNEYKMDVSNLSQGSYMMKIMQNNQVITKRFNLVK